MSMWPIGHVAVAYICYRSSTRVRFEASPATGPALVLVIASQFPDLVDKPLAWYAGALPTGRTLAHSLVFLVPLSIVLYLLARRYDRGEYGIAFGIGAISHALVDAVPVLWNPDAEAAFLLWPLLPVAPYDNGAPTLAGLLGDSLTDPYFHLEFVLLAIALVLWRRDGYPGLEPIRAVFDRGR